MRKSSPSLVAAVLAIAAMLTSPICRPAEAGYRRAPSGWSHERTVVHYGHSPRYRHRYVTYAGSDPYAYRYRPRGYYPYYNSDYWVPAYKLRGKRPGDFAHPPYYQAWGRPNHYYRSRERHRWEDVYVRREHW